jgi:uncharacterized protein (DUF362 family)
MNLIESSIGLAVADRNAPFSGYDVPEHVAALIAGALCSAGLGQSEKNAPLRDIIEPGMTVLLKPNWVLHSNMSGKGMDCMITHPVFIEEVIKQVAKASPGRIILADAPIQRAVFPQIVPPDWQQRLRSLAHPCRLDIIDFRKHIRCESGQHIQVSAGERSPSDYNLFDIGSRSLLEPISHPAGKFRITCYDPDAMPQTHCSGRHQFLLSREFFDADVVLNLPKLKSHRKSGITAALKNLVGINGDKSFLPHHRVGGSLQGGDCYEGKTLFKHLAERCCDSANRRINSRSFYPFSKAAEILLRLNRALHGEDELDGGWYGNDTVWRMVLDINRIAVYGGKDGVILPHPQRRIYSLTDAVIAGEGLGPLAPEPVPLGAVTFASSSAYADLAHTALMRFDWRKIPLVRHSFDRFDYPLTGSGPETVRINISGESYDLPGLAERWGVDFRPAGGWEGHIELDR